VLVAVSSNGVDFVNVTSHPFTFLVESTFFAIEPMQGPLGGGTLVKVTGNQFVASSKARCRFGTDEVPARFVSASEVQCYSPARAAPGAVTFNLTTNGVDYSTNAIVFNYTAQTVVSSLSPRTGAAAGGTSVVVHGSNFEGAAVSCRFGEAAGVAATNVTAGSCTCVAPAGAAGSSVAVEVSTNGVDYTSSGV